MNDKNDEPSFACVAFHGVEILLGTIDFVPEDKRDSKGIGIQLYIEVPVVTSIEEMYQIAEQNKLEIIKPLETRDWGEKTFVINDYDGYNLMFAQQVKSH